jgi:ribosomal protein S18 acetylase RimI-like enzyme
VIAALHAADYVEMRDEPFGLDQRAPAAKTSVVLPDGYVLRDAGQVSVEVRVEAHRRSWLPAALPYVEDFRPGVPADAESGFSAEKLARTQQLEPYAAERDFVITTRDGEPAACCTVWYDDRIGAAEIEPLGVVPEHRRRGLAQALCRAALNAVAEVGGVEVVIHPRGDRAYPAPRAAYAAAGFRAVNRTRTYGRG